MKIQVFDIETDGLKPTLIHCLSSGGRTTNKPANIKSFLDKAEVLVGHNIIRYDMPALEKVLGLTTKALLVDTLALSWYLYPDRIKHGLAEWGEEFGVPKPVVDDWEDLPYEVYAHRCEQDVIINTKLWDKMWRHLLRLYGGEEEAWRLVEYLTAKMQMAAEQEKHKWKLDIPRCTAGLDELEAAREVKVEELFHAMPKLPVMAVKKKPAKMFLKGKVNTLSVAGESWLAFLAEHGYDAAHQEDVGYVKEYKEPNPGSPEQVKAWLYSLGWEPATFQYKRDKDTGDVRKIPQVQQDKTKGPGLCSSVKRLYIHEPKLEALDGLSILTHRISILQGFLNNVDDEGYVRAEIQGLTNTLRFKHRVVVNLPGVDKLYGDLIRGCLVAPEGYELCGSDMSSLEDRTKQHYMWDFDPDYVRAMMTDDFDPHLDLAQFAGELTPIQVAMHKAGEANHGGVRKVYKGVNYACVYGAGAATVSRSAGCTLQKGEKLVEAYWKRNWSVKKIADAQVVKTCMGMKWLFNPVSKLWYSLRYEKDRFSTLNQGTGVWCFDNWLIECGRDCGPMKMIGQFHDECIWLIPKGKRARVEKHVRDAIARTNDVLKLNRDLDVSVDFGLTYSEIH